MAKTETSELEGDDRIEAVARVVHEAIRAWQAAHGQTAVPHWRQAPSWMKVSTRESVQFTLDNPDAPSSAQHDQWMAQKEAAGWTFGEVKDERKKTHPMLKPYGALPDMEKRKDALFKAIVSALV